MRDRNWIEINQLEHPYRVQVDANMIDGEPRDSYMRHTPPNDMSGQLWMPGPSPVAPRFAA